MNCLSYFHFSVQPKVVLGLKSKTQLSKGEDLQLKCDINGIPAPSISWKQDESILNKTQFNITEKLDESKNTTISILVLKEVDDTREGNYTCVGLNTVGNVSSTTMLNVNKG